MKDIVREYIENKYEKDKIIKSDKEKEVILLKDRITGELCFCKIIKRKCEIYKRLKAINSRFIPKIYYLAYDENETVVIEEYILGENFRQILNKEESIAEKRVIDIALKLCRAIRLLHKNNIIHRDIKPENVMLDINGDIRLIDFDAARQNKKNAENDTVYLGTEGYAPPEQYGYMQTDKRADIYTLGVFIYELLGKAGYKGKLKGIIKKCVNFDPKGRYNSALRLELAILIKKYSAYIALGIAVLVMLSTIGSIFNDPHERYNLINLSYNMFGDNKAVKNMLSNRNNEKGLKQAGSWVYKSNENIKAEFISDGENLTFSLTDLTSGEVLKQGKADIIDDKRAVYNEGEYEMYIELYSNLAYIFDNGKALGYAEEKYIGGYYEE